MKLKSAPVRFKADSDSAGTSGEFEAIVSVFGNVDSWGDVVQPGAFTDTIAAWKGSHNSLPVLWSHRMDDPNYNIGEVLDIGELGPGAPEIPDWVAPEVRDNGGLWVKGRIDTGGDASPIAVHALRLLKARRVTQFSYAYDEVDAGWAKVDGREVWELRKLKLYEVSPTQIGANELTELLAAKAGAHVGRALSASNEHDIRQALALLNGVAGALDRDDDKCEEAKSEEPCGVKLSRNSPESSRLLRKVIRQQITVCEAID
jgi:phage head maturation protease